MEINKPIQVVYVPGTFGNALRWMFDRFSKGSKFKDVDSPWDDNGRVHGFKDEDYNIKFKRANQLGDKLDSPDPNALNVVISFQANDFIFVERCAFYRCPGNETDEKRYESIIKNADKEFVKQTFGNSNAKCVAKELYKIQFHDLQNHIWWNTINEYINDPKNYQFNINALLNEKTLVKELKIVSDKFNLDLQIESKVITNIVELIKNSYAVKTKERVLQALDAIVTKKNLNCADFDIVEQAFIESELEKIYDSVLFPYGTNWFYNTSDIHKFLSTYPTYLKHMNPRLPWYNNIRNPYYLTGKIDKSK